MLEKLISDLRTRQPRILVVGDFMMDCYLWTACERLSPEAPVPIARALRREYRPGGAANVAMNLAALGARCLSLGVLGEDEAGGFLRRQLRGQFLAQPGRPTPVKTRIMAQNQQILRLDEEEAGPIALEDELLGEFARLAPDFELVILSDYAKGTLTPRVCAGLISTAGQLGLPVLVDPKGPDFSKYTGATLLTPNKKEAALALKIDELSPEKLPAALARMREDFALDYALITLSAEGIALLGEELSIVPARAIEVFDVTGAGDCVISMLGFALACGAGILPACELANLAAAASLGHIGVASPGWDEIAGRLGPVPANFEAKIKSQDELVKLTQAARAAGKRIIFTNGCFDLLHLGHAKYLTQARALGDLLIVGLNSDASLRRLKGEARPVNAQAARAGLLAALSSVDFVVIFEEDTPENLVRLIAPDLLVKGEDYAGQVLAGAGAAGGVKLINFEPGFSTTAIIQKIRSQR